MKIHVKAILVTIGLSILGFIGGIFAGKRSSGNDDNRNLDGIEDELRLERERVKSERERVTNEGDSIKRERELIDRDRDLLAELERRNTEAG